MGQEIRTGQSDEFKAMEMEMQLRHEGTHRALIVGGTGIVTDWCFQCRYGQITAQYDDLRQVPF